MSRDELGRVGMSWDELGRVGTSWDKLGRVGNQRNYRILKFKKTSLEEEENIGYRVASNKRRLKNMQIKFPIRTDKMLLVY